MTEPTDPSHLADRPPGYHEDDPYENEDISEFPAWWRRNIEEFRQYELRPFQPPQFEDGDVVQTVIEDLEAEHDVTIQLRVVNPQDGNDWEVVVEDAVVGTIARDRHVDGFSVFYATTEEFRRMVLDAV